MRRSHLGAVLVLFLAAVLALGPVLSQAVQAQTYKHEPCQVLSGLAEAKKSSREIAAWVSLASGAAGLLLFTALGSPIFGIIAGGIGGLGFFLNTLPSDAERMLANSSGQQKDCYFSLEQLSDSARNARYLSAIANGVGGLAALAFSTYSYDLLYGALYGLGMATYQFLMPSEEEQAFAKVAIVPAQ